MISSAEWRRRRGAIRSSGLPAGRDLTILAGPHPGGNVTGGETALPTANGGCCEVSYDRDVRAGGWGAFRQPSQGNRLGGQLSAMAHRPRVRDLGQLAG